MFFKEGRMVTRKQKIQEISIPTCIIQRVEALAVSNIQDLADGNETLFINRFADQNDFVAALHEGGITVVVQEDDEQDGDNNDGDSNTNEYP